MHAAYGCSYNPCTKGLCSHKGTLELVYSFVRTLILYTVGGSNCKDHMILCSDVERVCHEDPYLNIGGGCFTLEVD